MSRLVHCGCGHLAESLTEHNRHLAAADHEDLGESFLSPTFDAPAVPACASLDPDRTVQACPECDHPHVKPLSSGWRCDQCGARFERPVERQADDWGVGPRPAPGTLADRLLEADPDDIGRPMTDGGTDADPETGSRVQRAEQALLEGADE